MKTAKTNDFPWTHQGNKLPSNCRLKIWRVWTIQNHSWDLLHGSRNWASHSPVGTLSWCLHELLDAECHYHEREQRLGHSAKRVPLFPGLYLLGMSPGPPSDDQRQIPLDPWQEEGGIFVNTPKPSPQQRPTLQGPSSEHYLRWRQSIAVTSASCSLSTSPEKSFATQETLMQAQVRSNTHGKQWCSPHVPECSLSSLFELHTNKRLQPNNSRLQIEEQQCMDFLSGGVHRKALQNEAAYQMVRKNQCRDEARHIASLRAMTCMLKLPDREYRMTMITTLRTQWKS